MNNKLLNTKYTFTFADDTTADLTLSFYALYQLKGANRDLYDRYNATTAKMASQKGKSYDELDMITILYTAYMCANLNEADLLTEEEFMIKCGSDRKSVASAISALMTPKN